MDHAAAPHLLVMTATITPPAGVFASHRNDPAQRLADCAQALEFYLSDRCRLIDRIVFIDNSLADLSPLEKIARDRGGKQVEFLSFYGLDYPLEYHKGYGEFKLIDYGFANSRLLAELGPHDKWWKVTGRYRTSNLDALVRTAPQVYDVYTDFRKWKRRAEVRVMSFSRRGYERLCLGRYHEITGIPLEDWVYRELAPSRNGRGTSDLVIVSEFYYVPRIEGFAGYKNRNYMTGKYGMIYRARATLQFFKNLVRPAP